MSLYGRSAQGSRQHRSRPNEVCGTIRSTIASLYSDEVAEATVIQYGGSMNDGNAAELLSKVNVDGGLIGGASLVPAKFAKIVEAAQA